MHPRTVLLILFSLFALRSSFAKDLTLAWDPPLNPTGVTGYLLCYGVESGRYTTEIDVGNATTFTLSSLNPGVYYLAVKAYGKNGERSAYSNEIFEVVDSPRVTLETAEYAGRLFYILCNWGDAPVTVALTFAGEVFPVLLDPGEYLVLDSPPDSFTVIQ